MTSASATINWNPYLNKSSATCIFRSAHCKKLETDFHGSLSYSKNCPHTSLMCAPGCSRWTYFLLDCCKCFQLKYQMFDGFL